MYVSQINVYQEPAIVENGPVFRLFLVFPSVYSTTGWQGVVSLVMLPCSPKRTPAAPRRIVLRLITVQYVLWSKNTGGIFMPLAKFRRDVNPGKSRPPAPPHLHTLSPVLLYGMLLIRDQQVCADICNELGSTYFGTQYGSEVRSSTLQ